MDRWNCWRSVDISRSVHDHSSIYIKNNDPLPNFFLIAAAAILFLKDPSQKVIRASEIPREQLYKIWLQSNQRFISYCAHKLYWRPSSKTTVYDSVPPKKYIGRIAQGHRWYVENKFIKKNLVKKINPRPPPPPKKVPLKFFFKLGEKTPI